MGTWGSRAFDDDAAMDWADWTLVGTADWAEVERALRRAVVTEPTAELDQKPVRSRGLRPQWSRHHSRPRAFPFRIRLVQWVDRHRGICPGELRVLGRTALERVLSDGSELARAWHDLGPSGVRERVEKAAAEWRANVQLVAAVLSDN